MEKELRILATTDVHGYPLPMSFGKADLLIDAGDFFIGSPLATFYNTNYEISPLVKKANDLGYDIMIPGNHDFDGGLAFLQKQVRHLKAHYLCANITDLEDNLIFSPYKIITRNGLKIGVIGLMTSLLSTLLPYRFSKEFKCLDAQAALKKWFPIVKENADLVVIVYHGGLESDLKTGTPTQYHTGEDEAYKLASTVPADAFICGHQHRVNVGKVGNCQLIQPGFRGKCIGEVLFSPHGTSGKVWPLETVPVYPPEYLEWLEQPLDLSRFGKYLQTVTGAMPVMDFKGNKIKDFLDSFQPPYNILQYRLSDEEMKGIAKAAPSEDGHQVVTNRKDFLPYRLERQFVNNIFDEYLMYLKQS